MTPLESLRNAIEEIERSTSGKLSKLEVPANIATKIRKELGLAVDADIVVDGVPIHIMSKRGELLNQASAYAAARWDVMMDLSDVDNLFKAVDTREMPSLIAIMVDQHLDDKGFPDPTDEMTEEGVEDMRKVLEEIGIVNPTI